MAERYATTPQAAEAIGVHLVTLQRWAHDGIVEPALRTAGGRYRWDIEDLKRQLRYRAEAKGLPPVIAAVVTSSKGVLVTRRLDGHPLWGFPTGTAMKGEAPADAAIREVKEETDLLVKAGHGLGERDHPRTGRHMVYLACRPYQGTAVRVADEAELAEVRWAGLTEATDLMPDMFGPVREHLERVLGQ